MRMPELVRGEAPTDAGRDGGHAGIALSRFRPTRCAPGSWRWLIEMT
jgi:hypothetical protein